MMPVCPKCDVALILLEFNGVQVDYCPKCEGFWLDSGEIEELLDRSGGRRGDPLINFFESCSRRETGRPAYLCPRCDRELKEVARRSADGHELRVDRCPRGDGIWFDKNELHLLLEAMPDEMEAHGAIAVLTEVLGNFAEDKPKGDIE